MGSFSIWHWLIVLAVVALLFGAGRISGVMGDVGKGIKSFKKGLADDDNDGPAAPGAAPRTPERITDERPVDQRSSTTTSDVEKR
jgi:sec-independent protein translocase protein TatA